MNVGRPDVMTILAGDVGGTKTDLAFVTEDGGPRHPVAEVTFSSRSYPDLLEMIDEFLGGVNRMPDRVVLGLAGPVVGGHARVTNLPWSVDASAIGQRVGTGDVTLMNDLQAIACAVPHLEQWDLRTIHDRRPARQGTIAVIAPGTGLGEAFLVWDGQRYRAYPSEGGHVDFAPRNDREIALLRFMLARHSHVSYERVCSGMAIPDLYRFAETVGTLTPDPALTRIIGDADDATPVIVDGAMRGDPCPVCRAAVEIFCTVLAAEAGNLALKVLATGGVYVAGGLPPRCLPLLEHPDFLRAYRHKGRFEELLDAIPVHVITNPKAGILGAAWKGMELPMRRANEEGLGHDGHERHGRCASHQDADGAGPMKWG